MAEPEQVAEPAALLRDFVNTLDLEAGTDMLDCPAALTGWLRSRRLVAARARAGTRDLQAAIALRKGLRDAMASHHDLSRGRGDAYRQLDSAAAGLPLRLTTRTGRPALEPIEGGIRAGLGRIAAAVVDCDADGSWERLKVCAETGCRWAFLDTSKNRSRSWCAMSVCGNRRKTRAYRDRRRSARTSAITDGAPC